MKNSPRSCTICTNDISKRKIMSALLLEAEATELEQVCRRCKVSKKLSQFHIDRTAKNGHRGECRDCSSKRRMEYKQRMKELHAQTMPEQNDEQNDEEQPKKVCTRCKKEKYISEFHRDRAKPSGYRSTCKTCVKIHDFHYANGVRIRPTRSKSDPAKPKQTRSRKQKPEIPTVAPVTVWSRSTRIYKDWDRAAARVNFLYNQCGVWPGIRIFRDGPEVEYALTFDPLGDQV
jgi:hypothetical protein